ncbi:MAG: hypothetical protein QM775_10445 [Pirellulales bacterium]
MLGSAQTWVNYSTATLTVGGAVTNGGNTLTLTGIPGIATTGLFTINGAISGTGGLNIVRNASATLNAASGYTGATVIGNASTLTLAGAGGALTATSGITLNGGSLAMVNDVGQHLVDRVNAVGITSNGGTITWTNPSGDNTANWAETLGVLSLAKGNTNIIVPNVVNAAHTQNLTLGAGSLTHAAGNTSTVMFGGTSLGTSTTNNIRITSLADTALNQIIGAWATFGASATAQTDYASYNRNAGTTNTRGIQAAGIANSAETTWTSSSQSYTTTSTTPTLTATRTIGSLRYNAGTGTLALGALEL